MHDDATVIISLASPLPALGEIGEIGENRENRENRENGENACSLIALKKRGWKASFLMQSSTWQERAYDKAQRHMHDFKLGKVSAHSLQTSG